MHHAFKANLLAASQDALNRNQSQLLPGNSQASHAFELLGFLCCFLFLSLASLEHLEAKAFLFHQLSWWLLYAEANKAKKSLERGSFSL